MSNAVIHIFLWKLAFTPQHFKTIRSFKKIKGNGLTTMINHKLTE